MGFSTFPWVPTREYLEGETVLYAGKRWVARRDNFGDKPGASDAWRNQEFALSTPKATMAQALDERIGRGA